MTRKHYVAIAKILNEQFEHGVKCDNYFAQVTVTRLATKMADKFQAMNSRFDRQRFMDAVRWGGK